MEIKQFKLGDAQSNCYIISKEKECFIIDPGIEASELVAYIKKNKLEPQFIFITHGHFDHVGGVRYLKELYHIPVYAPLKDKIWMKESVYNPFSYDIPVDQWVVNDDKIDFRDLSFLVMALPGHSEGSCGLYSYPYLFSGDVIFQNNYGRHDLPFSNFEQLKQSIRKIFSLPDDVIIYPGHGEITHVKTEKDNNPINQVLK